MYIRTYQPSLLELFNPLILKFVLVIIINKEKFLFSLLVLFDFLSLSLGYIYDFLLYQGIINEDCSILNMTGQSSSEGSSQQGISGGGGGSSNNPNPGPNPGHDPGPGPHYGTHLSYFNTVIAKDTDVLAIYLEIHRGKFFSELVLCLLIIRVLMDQ
jgi:hypothetical protein